LIFVVTLSARPENIGHLAGANLLGQGRAGGQNKAARHFLVGDGPNGRAKSCLGRCQKGYLAKY
jgi:hypothetical protein